MNLFASIILSFLKNLFLASSWIIFREKSRSDCANPALAEKAVFMRKYQGYETEKF